MANVNASAGDIVYLRGGTYVLDSKGPVGISPRNRGTSTSDRITFAAYPGETPVIEGAGGYDVGWGIDLYCGIGEGIGTYIHITGITFHNCARWATLRNYANFNEIDHCVFYSDTGEDVVQGFKICGARIGGMARNGYSTHNWIHHNVFSKAHRSSNDPSINYEGRDLMDIGDSYSSTWPEDEYKNNNNTIEDNYFEYAGHTCFDGFGMYTVFKNNKLHNEPWITAGGSRAAYANDQYLNPAYNGKYGHRTLGISNDVDRPGTYNLLEGNRLGFASTNPNNNGADNLDLMAPRNIVRFNDIFGAMNSGMMFKYGYSKRGHGGTNNRLYNNTLYHNGYGNPFYETIQVLRNSTSPEALLHIRFYASDTIGNVVKNNLLYDSRRYALSGFDIGSGANNPGYPSNNIITNNWLTSDGDPNFTNPDMTNPSSETLPDLTLKSSSGAIDRGSYLTQAKGSSSSSTTLIVDDAMYFQDGTWGSALAKATSGLGGTFQADWIAIGTVGNIVAISSIDYGKNTITLASPTTWKEGDKIWLYKDSSGRIVLNGAAPDFGAHEYAGFRPDR